MSEVRGLSFTAGGVREYPNIIIQDHLENLLGATLHEKFNLIGATSSGTIPACGGAHTKEGKRLYSPQDLITSFHENSPRIFQRRNRWPGSSWALASKKYRDDGMDTVFAETYGDLRLSDLRENIIIAAADISDNFDPVYFNTAKARAEEQHNVRLLDAALSSMRVQGYFTPYMFSHHGRDYKMIDGGVFCPCPAAEVQTRLERQFGLEHDFLHVCFGTGITQDRKRFNKAERWSGIKWLRHSPYTSIMALTKETLRKMQTKLAENFVHIDIPYEHRHKKLPQPSRDFGCATRQNFRALEACAMEWIKSKDGRNTIAFLKERLQNASVTPVPSTKKEARIKHLDIHAPRFTFAPRSGTGTGMSGTRRNKLSTPHLQLIHGQNTEAHPPPRPMHPFFNQDYATRHRSSPAPEA